MFGPILILAALQSHFNQALKPEALIAKVKDPEIRAGLAAAIDKNLMPAATELMYPGHFTISADGGAFGSDTTWPGLDSWQMAGAYLLIGKTRLVTDYFDFVRASQRKDGNIPFAIFTGDTQPGDTWLRGLKLDDVFTYVPPVRPAATKSSQETRKWIGLFRHWELESNPLSTLGPICYILTASEIDDAIHDRKWLAGRLPSIEATGNYLVSKITGNGLLSGSGFYTELPPRMGWDGVTQCYAYEAFRDLAKLEDSAGRSAEAKAWVGHADRLKKAFSAAFWRQDHFGEYVHPSRGLVDIHGLSDPNWAAIAFGVADAQQTRILWPRLIGDQGFWLGGMPTQTVTKPFTYEAWENEPVPFQSATVNDVAAMGRTWYLEALACRRMHANDRLISSARLVSKAAQDGFWRERYHPLRDGTIRPDGAAKYCEYPAVLIRVVLGNKKVFLK